MLTAAQPAAAALPRSRSRLNPEHSENNLNLIRLILAALVMVSHAFPLCYAATDNEPLKRWTHGQETFGSLAVNLFFLISGMLITASWLRSSSIADFLRRRVLRIYPGFVVALAVSALLVCILSSGFRSHVAHDPAWFQNFVTDAAVLSVRSTFWPGIFAGNPYPGVSNGSLWTIQKEFLCYLLVAGIGLLSLLKRRVLILSAGVLICGVYMLQLAHTQPAWGHLKTNPNEHLFLRFYAYFLVGMIVWLFRDRIIFSRTAALASFAALTASVLFPPLFSILFLPLGSYAVLCFGFMRPSRFTRWTLNTDLSYGIYLYAWPVQQVVIMFSGSRSPYLNLLMAIPITVILAALSWHLVERRFLGMKSVRKIGYEPARVRAHIAIPE